jgi:hypothetical protein
MSTDPELGDGLHRLSQLDLKQLRKPWAELFGPPPKLRSPELLRHLIAWRLQAAAHGGLDHQTRRKLTGPGPVEAEGRDRGLGAVLRREWQGRPIEVVVEVDGFKWNAKTWPSLSAVARVATGTRWNGPRFFGLRADQV